MREIRIGIIGLGTVGTGVVKILSYGASRLQEHSGVKFTVKRIADIDITTPRPIEIDRSILTTDAMEVINDDEIDVVVELIGGYEPAKTYILCAIERGKHVVTANKALLAQSWVEIFSKAREYKKEVLFEAAVGGGIPIIRSMMYLLASNKIHSIFGIINGTCNYILTAMSKEGRSFNEALSQAKIEGYAEADPTLDIEGIDTAHKLSILSSLAFGEEIPLEKIYIEGISKIEEKDILYAKEEFGYCIKLLGIAKDTNGELELRVHPTMIPEGHPLSDIDGIYNAIYLKGDSIGSLLFSGQGAGQMPTASSVVSDLVYLAQGIEVPLGRYINPKKTKRIKRIEDLMSRYYVRFTTLDQPGVLAAISSILAKYGISISSVIQKGRMPNEVVPIIMLSHEAKEEDMRKAISEINRLPVVKAESIVIRCEDI